MEQGSLFDVIPTEKHKVVKITGINGYEFFVGDDSVVHGYAKIAKQLGVTWEYIETNYDNFGIVKNLSTLIVYSGTINPNKFATPHQAWALQRYIINELRNPCMPTPNITKDICA